jgi:two-component SAPR family response regulator
MTRYQYSSGWGIEPGDAERLAQAIELYTGHLLESIHEEWCRRDRERLYLLYTNALKKLMDFHEINGSYERALVYGKRIPSSDGVYEKAHRQMERLHHMLADRAVAQVQYTH